jgi:hypothetical protein
MKAYRKTCSLFSLCDIYKVAQLRHCQSLAPVNNALCTNSESLRWACPGSAATFSLRSSQVGAIRTLYLHSPMSDTSLPTQES